MDESSFDKLVRELTGTSPTRRALVLSGFGLSCAVATPLAEDSEAARRRRARRKKRRNRKRKGGSSGTGGKRGNAQETGDTCQILESCPADPKSGAPGFPCPDGRCSCGGQCCSEDFSCFARTQPADEVCCYDVPGAVEVPAEVEFTVCPGAIEPRDTCCRPTECTDGECQTLAPGRYRRNPR